MCFCKHSSDCTGVFISNSVHRCISVRCYRKRCASLKLTVRLSVWVINFTLWFRQCGGVGGGEIRDLDMVRMKGGVHWEGEGLFGISDELARQRQDRTCCKTRRNVGVCAHAQLVFYKSMFALCTGCFGTRVENSFMSRWNLLLWLFKDGPSYPPCMRTLGHTFTIVSWLTRWTAANRTLQPWFCISCIEAEVWAVGG